MSYERLIGRTWDENRLFSVLVELTYRCNLDCFFCYNDLNLRGTPLTFEQYDLFLQDLVALNVLNVTLSGGEPLSHPDFFRIGARARELGFVVRVKSNGHALRGDMARRLREEVDPFVVEVSLHGATAATHDRQTRVPGSFERLVSNLRGMHDIGLRVKINSTLTVWNEGETAAMYELCDTLGMPLRFDLQVTPRDDGGREPLAVAPTADGIRHLLAIQTARSGDAASEPRGPSADDDLPKPPGKHCGAGSAGIAIDPYGNVYPCVQWRRPVGNLHDQSIRSIWTFSEALEGIRAETVAVRDVVASHPRGGLLNFCPGLAEVLTGSAMKVPPEMERHAEILEGAAGFSPPDQGTAG
jgi:MoaA/NifB/PqqE/SkfB family radical SAM enzyme